MVSVVITDKQFDYLKRLIQRRGYEITKRVEGEKEGIIDIHAKTTKKKIKGTLLVRVILDTPSVGVEILRNTIKERDKGEFTHAIIIGGERYTYAARREAKEMDVELLHRRFLSIDAEIEQEYGIGREQLPKIRAGDPAAKAIGARPGDVIRIVRGSETAGRHVVYRYCIA
jgi:DNA-directed RNA polymerase subunit H (RpoH/RPB5)